MKLGFRHISQLREQPATAYLNEYLDADNEKNLVNAKYSYAIEIGGRLIACAGVVEYWPGRGEAWAILDQNCKKEFLQLHGVVKRFLKVCPVRRIEAAVDTGFRAGHRWVRALGFEMEAQRLKGYRPDGGDCSLYALIKEGI